MNHTRKSIRLSNRDYSWKGRYFVTICTWKHECYLGDITNGSMILSPVGKVVWDCWMQIPGHYLNVNLGPFVVMPNHVHGVISINDYKSTISVGTCHGMSLQFQTGMSLAGSTEKAIIHGSNDGHNKLHKPEIPFKQLDPDSRASGTCHGMSLQKMGTDYLGLKLNHFSKPVAGSVSMIMNHLKGSVTRWCNKNGHRYFAWQKRFYDHVISSEEDYLRIEKYIIENPVNWDTDDYNKRNT